MVITEGTLLPEAIEQEKAVIVAGEIKKQELKEHKRRLRERQTHRKQAGLNSILSKISSKPDRLCLDCGGFRKLSNHIDFTQNRTSTAVEQAQEPNEGVKLETMFLNSIPGSLDPRLSFLSQICDQCPKNREAREESDISDQHGVVATEGGIFSNGFLRILPKLYRDIPKLADILSDSELGKHGESDSSTVVDRLFWNVIPGQCTPDRCTLSEVADDQVIAGEKKRQEKYEKKLMRKFEDGDIDEAKMWELWAKHARSSGERREIGDVHGTRVESSLKLLSADRGCRKRWQVENFVSLFLASPKKCVIDFGCGSGNLCLALAPHFPDTKFIFVDRNAESLQLLRERGKNLKNIEVKQMNFTLNHYRLDGGDGQFDLLPDFDLGIGLHCCGAFTDLVMDICRAHGADSIVCPCCNGKVDRDIQRERAQEPKEVDKEECKTAPSVPVQSNPDRFQYPRSDWLRKSVTEDEYCLISRAADDNNNYLAKCLIECDRAVWGMENGYLPYLLKLNPSSASPKHHVIYLKKRDEQEAE